jgi:DNA ligase (NAD+)
MLPTLSVFLLAMSLGPVATADRAAMLRAEIARHDRLYHVDNTPEISDRAYDALVYELAALEAAAAGSAAGDEVTFGFADDHHPAADRQPHCRPMLSLDKIRDAAQWNGWDARLRRRLQRDGPLPYLIEPKIDGVAVSLVYADGRFLRAVLRGDGHAGDDVTASMDGIAGIPANLTDAGAPSLVEVRGELYFAHAAFARLQMQRAADGAVAWAHPRHLAAATLRHQDATTAAQRGLAFLAFALGCAGGLEDEAPSAQRSRLGAWGFAVPEPVWHATGIDALQEVLAAADAARADWPIPNDGLVIKLDLPGLHANPGATRRAPRWAAAWKFRQPHVRSRLVAIHWQTGPGGRETPVAEIEPVQLHGITVRRATLHNAAYLERLGLEVGDMVDVELAGGIVPAIVSKVGSDEADPAARP